MIDPAPVDVAESTRWTVDELAELVGVSVRTIRFYTGEGLVPPPRRAGRGAFYDDRHRLRLELVRTLQERGYTLTAIGRVLGRIPLDAPAAQYALQAAVLAPWVPDAGTAVRVHTRAGLERLAGRKLDDEQLALLDAVGVVHATGDARYRTDATALRHVLDLLDLPVLPAVLTRSAALIEQHANAVAEGLTEIFAQEVWTPYQRGELDADEVATVLARLRLLAVQDLVAAFTRAADSVVRRRIEE